MEYKIYENKTVSTMFYNKMEALPWQNNIDLSTDSADEKCGLKVGNGECKRGEDTE